jgi:hypothetical protein
MKRIISATALLALSGLLGPGCVGRAISEGVEKTLGPSGYCLPIEPKWPQKDQGYLAKYQSFELAPVKSEFPDTPREFMADFPTRFSSQMTSKGLPMNRPGKALQIQVTILAYQSSSSTVSTALGPTEEVVARVDFVDKDAGKPIGRAICIGRTYQTIGMGTEWKSWGLCRAIVNKCLDNYYPKEGRKEAEEKAAAAKE